MIVVIGDIQFVRVILNEMKMITLEKFLFNTIKSKINILIN